MKKRILLIITTLILTTALFACGLDNASTENTTFLTSQEKVTATTTTTTLSPLTASTSSTSTIPRTSNGVVPFIPSGYSLLQDQMSYLGIPATGNVKVLVFAVDFSDYPNSKSSTSIDDIKKGFNGTSSEITYESVNSYYFKSSFGQLNITADVYGYYRASKPASYYEDEYEKRYETNFWGNPKYSEDELTYPDSDLINELLTYYDSQINYKDYDSNHDGYIDGIYVIYTHPVSYYSGSELWWAYKDWYNYSGDKFDRVEPLYFTWCGTEFFEEGYDNVNARTVIHETGHMLGLDDYYDYYDDDIYDNDGGLGGADMMDASVGDHDPFSKLLLGWIHPLVVESSMTVDITPFLMQGDVILITPHWNGTIFDEYLLISYYTPTGLNEDDRNMIFSYSGIVIYHVSAKIGNGYDPNSYYSSLFNYNNTDTIHKLIKIIEADTNGHIDKYGIAEDGDLFQVGDILGYNIYPQYRWYSGDYLGITVEIVSIGAQSAKIEIQFNN